MANVLAFAETRGGELRKVALEVVTAARKLADASGGGEVHVLLAGEPGIGGRAEQLGRYGADVVYVAESADFAKFARESIAATLADRAKAELPPERPAGRIIGEGAAAVPELVRLLQTEAKVL